MSQRFFSSEPIVGSRASLADSEAHHLGRVLRAAAGDCVTLFDGSGAEFEARIERITKTTVELAIVARREISRELPFVLTLAVALPKGERQRWLVEKAVELGVTRLVPLVTMRSVAEPSAAVERLRRAVIEASKQCGRNRLMEIQRPAKWAEFCQQPAAANVERWFAQITATEGFPPRGEKPGEIVVAIGPEGDWTDEEISLAAAANWKPVNLGPRILRVETAAIALAAIAAVG